MGSFLAYPVERCKACHRAAVVADTRRAGRRVVAAVDTYPVEHRAAAVADKRPVAYRMAVTAEVMEDMYPVGCKNHLVPAVAVVHRYLAEYMDLADKTSCLSFPIPERNGK
jgi:hypothetical protein